MILPNYVYYSYWLEKWFNLLLIKGKKETAENFTIKLLTYWKLHFGLYPYFVFNEYILKNKIAVETRSYKKSNICYEVPFPIEIKRQYKQSLHWILMSLRDQHKTSFKFNVLHQIIQFFFVKINLSQKHNQEQLQLLIKNRVYQQYRW